VVAKDPRNKVSSSGSFGLSVIILLAAFSCARGQGTGPLAGLGFQVSAFADFTTSARVYTAPRDQDPFISSFYNGLGGFISAGGDVRVILSRSETVGLTLQSLNSTQTVNTIYGYDPDGSYVGVPVRDGFNLWLLELNGYFNIPIVSGRWNIYLGGGPGFYFGRRNLQIGNDAANTPYVAAFGIQVEAGASFKFADRWGMRSEMKFRSPEFSTTSTFNASSTTYQGVQVTLPETLYGKVDVDGTDFTLGVFYEF